MLPEFKTRLTASRYRVCLALLPNQDRNSQRTGQQELVEEVEVRFPRVFHSGQPWPVSVQVPFRDVRPTESV